MNEEATTILPGLAGKMVKYCPLPGPNRLQLGEFGPLARLEGNDLVWIFFLQFFITSKESFPKCSNRGVFPTLPWTLSNSPQLNIYGVLSPLYTSQWSLSSRSKRCVLPTRLSLPNCPYLSVKTHGVLPIPPSPPNGPSHNAQTIVCYLSFYV